MARGGGHAAWPADVLPLKALRLPVLAVVAAARDPWDEVTVKLRQEESAPQTSVSTMKLPKMPTIWREGNIPGGDLHPHAPYWKRVSQSECATVCMEIEACMATVWNRDGRCYLKAALPQDFVFFEESNTFAAIKPLALIGALAVAFKPSLAHIYVEIVVLRCNNPAQAESSPEVTDDGGISLKTPLNISQLPLGNNWPRVAGLPQYLTRMVPRPGQLVVYDTADSCRDPGLALTPPVGALRRFGGYAVSVICGHLLANLHVHYTGRNRRIYFINGVQDFEAPDHLDARGRRRPHVWKLGDFFDEATTRAVLPKGIHVLQSGPKSMPTTPQISRLEFLLHRLMKSSALPPQPARGLASCPLTKSELSMAALGRKRAIVTYLSSPDYLVLGRVLLHSLQKLGTEAHLVVALVEAAGQLSNEAMAGQLLQEFPDIDLVEWPLVSPPHLGREGRHLRMNYCKLNVFNMVEYDHVLYIDADVLALRNPDFIFDDPFVRAAKFPLLQSPDWGNNNQHPPSTKASSAVLLVRPSRKLFRCMESTLQQISPEDYNSMEAEQGFLRYFFGDDVTQLPYFFNMQKNLKWSLSDMWDESRTVLLHFAGAKPHRSWAPPDYYRFHRHKRSSTLAHGPDTSEIFDDEQPESVPVTMLWRRQYFNLVNFAQYLTVFVAYHDEGSYHQAMQLPRYADGVLEALPLAPVPQASSGPGAAFNLTPLDLLPELKDPVMQQQLGETGGLLAMAKATWYQKPWIGFTQYSELRKAVWREGVAADWSQIETVVKEGPDQRTLLFWYGIFAGSYWALTDRHHKGLRGVYELILSRMGVDVHQFRMPDNAFWPFGNFVIMPTTLLQEYARFTRRFIDLFREEYSVPGPGHCPFGHIDRDKGAHNYGARCIGYATERLVHLWAIIAGIRLRFVVDDADLRYRAGCKAHVSHCAVPSLDAMPARDWN